MPKNAAKMPGLEIGKKIGGIGLPTVLVQEGGYVSNTLAENLFQFVSAFRATIAESPE